MKTLKGILWIAPVALLMAGCAAPVERDTTIAEWQREGLLPPTGRATTQVYAQTPAPAYPAQPSIVVQTDAKRNASGDLVLAEAIRHEMEFDRGLAPSLQHVTIEIRNGQVFLTGAVKSDLDARVIVDDLRNIAGITKITNHLEIEPNLD